MIVLAIPYLGVYHLARHNL